MHGSTSTSRLAAAKSLAASDGHAGRIAECDRSEATVVAGGRRYLCTGPADDRGWFDAWIATIDLTPETAAVP
jgi:hypothetical protein